jgi:hypothetical protein
LRGTLQRVVLGGRSCDVVETFLSWAIESHQDAGVWDALSDVDILPAVHGQEDVNSACPNGAGAVRRYRPGRRTRAPAACTKARGTKPQARRPHWATVTRSSSWSVELTDPAAIRTRGARQGHCPVT